MSIAEGKALMAAVQQRVVGAQAASWAERHRCCETCGAGRHSKGSYPVIFMTLYGDVQLASPRLHRCPCLGSDGPASVSPLRTLIPDYVAPERLYLEARWSSLVPYAAAAGLLADVLPIISGANATTLREHTLRVAERAEAELAMGGFHRFPRSTHAHARGLVSHEFPPVPTPAKRSSNGADNGHRAGR